MHHDAANPVQRFTPDHPLWPAYVAHLERVGMGRGMALEVDGQAKVETIYFGVADGDAVVGNLALAVQEIVVPASESTGGLETPLLDGDRRPLRETYVLSFGVEEAHRRRGYGRGLQLAALEETRALGCHQMRSWSTTDKTANYALKLALGFAAHPAIHISRRGQPFSGVYWVKPVREG